MINVEEGTVERIIWSEDKMQCLEVQVGDKKEKAINYLELSGAASPGNRVFLNTTAVRLNLGSGGYHFVLLNTTASPYTPYSGHIIKMRYTPLQHKVMTWEEKCGTSEDNCNTKYTGLHVPVVIGELHSMLAPFARTLKLINTKCRIIYIMSDSASLPLSFSRNVRSLKNTGVLAGTITAGQAFGGDLECINIYTALIAAREELKADVIIITPGPGVVGTGTRYGYSGVEQGEHVERAHKLRGIPLVIPRISFADSRSRHRGISHHTLTALGELTTKSCFLPLPACSRGKMRLFYEQLAAAGLMAKHRVVTIGSKRFHKYLKECCGDCHTMGRGLRSDPIFFAAACASACLTEAVLKQQIKHIPARGGIIYL